jgi:hypothetical protein
MIRFLLSLPKRLNAWINKGSTDLGDMSLTETVSRYIFNKKHFSIDNKRVKYAAFIPNINKDSSEYETSVFRVSSLSEKDIWEIGKYVEKLRKQTLKARGDLKVQSILDNKLSVIAAPVSHYRHANIVNWPATKNERMLFAIQLEKSARLHIK